MNNVKSQIANTASAMIDGSLHYFKGAETLLALREEAGIYANDPDFLPFIAILNDIDYLRDNNFIFDWSRLNDDTLAPSIQSSLQWAKDLSLENCTSLVKRYAI